MRKRFLLVASLSLGLSVVACSAQSDEAPQSADTPDEAWEPDGDMRMIVGSGTGSAYDVLARGLAEEWSDHFGVDLIVESMGQAGGALALNHVATAEPDGLTIGVSTSAAQVSEHALPQFPWEAPEIPFILAAKIPPWVVVTGADSEYQSWDDFRNADRRVSIASTSVPIADIPYMGDLREHGVDVTTAVFDGTSETRAAIEAGDADLWSSVASLSVLEPIEEGTVTPLVQFADERYAELPDTPTHIEMGMPEHYQNIQGLRIFYAPIGTPDHIAEEISQRMEALITDPEMWAWGEERGLWVELISGAEARDLFTGHVGLLEEFDDLVAEFIEGS